MQRETALAAYGRVADWEARQTQLLNAEILKPIFGGCGCRMHNCKINFESGSIEGNYSDHQRKHALAKLYDHRQAKIWSVGGRLRKHFAKSF